MGRFSLGIAALCFLFAGVSVAGARQGTATIQQASSVSLHPAAYIVVDADSGMVLRQRDAAKVWYPASVTKLMTAYLTFQALRSGRLKLSSPVIETAAAVAQPPSKMGFAVGTSMTLDNALKMMLVPSSNDIAVAISQTVGGTEAHFVAEMNATARSLGMNSTHYDNPNGLPSPGQLTTARDLAVLARAILHTFPEYRSYFRIRAIQSGRRILRSENALLERYPGATGMKTGFICDSGFNVVASATRSGRTLIVVVLGAPTALWRAEFAAKLLDGGFSGGSFGFTRVELASYHASPSVGHAVNLHDSICGKHRLHPMEADVDVGDISSTLGPPTPTISPVVVHSSETDSGMIAKADTGMGGAGDVASVQPKSSKGMPLPRLRPVKVPTAPAAVKPIKAVVVKTAEQTTQ